MVFQGTWLVKNRKRDSITEAIKRHFGGEHVQIRFAEKHNNIHAAEILCEGQSSLQKWIFVYKYSKKHSGFAYAYEVYYQYERIIN